jgi:hypothetical protein
MTINALYVFKYEPLYLFAQNMLKRNRQGMQLKAKSKNLLSHGICQAASDREDRLHRSTQIFRDNNNDVGKADGLLIFIGYF